MFPVAVSVSRALFWCQPRARLPLALACFESERTWPFVTLIYLNGEGVPRNLQRAKAALRTGLKEDLHSFTYYRLEEALRTCERKSVRSCRRIDCCSDLAITNFDLEVCASAEQISAESKLSCKIAIVRSKLDPISRPIFDQTVGAFKAYQLADARRAAYAAIETPARSLAMSVKLAMTKLRLAELRYNPIRCLMTDSKDFALRSLWHQAASNLTTCSRERSALR
jgi:TPR repeat protein